ncbi:hypothetical protein [Mucilaginibacter sp. PPCGB 2223]|nr:hypothetical protein [Mucilaginibacter sp. PPCGB 2223]
MKNAAKFLRENFGLELRGKNGAPALNGGTQFYNEMKNCQRLIKTEF